MSSKLRKNLKNSLRRFKNPIKIFNSLNVLLIIVKKALRVYGWEFVAITDRGLLNRIAKILPNAVPCKTAPAAIVIVANPKSGRLEGYYPQECGAAAQNILLQAVDMRLGACWCGIWPVEERISVVRALLNMAKEKIPFCVIAVGMADEIPRLRKNHEPLEVTRFAP